MRQRRDHLTIFSRRRLLAGGLLSGSALLVACGASSTKLPATTAVRTAGAAPPAAETKAANLATPPRALPTVTPSIGNIGAGKQMITFWNPFDGPDLVTVTKMLQLFVKANPECQVHQEALTQAILYQKLPPAIIAGSPPDLAIIHIWALAQFSTRGLLRDASDLYQGHGFTTPIINEAAQ